MSSSSPPAELLDVAAEVLPDTDLTYSRATRGQDHDVLLVPQVAAVRVARHDVAAAAMPRRTALLVRLAGMGLPFAVPEPLTDMVRVGGRAVVATSWVPGAVRSRGDADPESLAAVLRALREVTVDDLGDVLDRPHAYAGRERWYELMLQEAIPRLPVRLRDEARRRTDQAAALPPEEACLVHGDLAGENVHWDERGRVVGVIDWDLAAPFDQAVDVACLAFFGWDSVRAAVDPTTYARARTWSRTFGIEQIVAAVLNDDPRSSVDGFVEATVRWLDQSAGM
jgi:aminoglycoside phosphotransferase (APT) family kinase protein